MKLWNWTILILGYALYAVVSLACGIADVVGKIMRWMKMSRNTNNGH